MPGKSLECQQWNKDLKCVRKIWKLCFKSQRQKPQSAHRRVDNWVLIRLSVPVDPRVVSYSEFEGKRWTIVKLLFFRPHECGFLWFLSRQLVMNANVLQTSLTSQWSAPTKEILINSLQDSVSPCITRLMQLILNSFQTQISSSTHHREGISFISACASFSRKSLTLEQSHSNEQNKFCCDRK